MASPTSTVPLPLYLTDHLRSLSSFGCLLAAQPWLASAPRGTGEAVIVMPGLAANDLSTAPLRGYLRGLGYDAQGWGLGVNIGPTRKVLNGLQPLVEKLAAHRGSKVALVGWSLGGIYARMIAKQIPEAISQVITMGSPFRLVHGHQSRASRLFDRLAPLQAPREEWPEQEANPAPLLVPGTSIYSRLDGIVDWRCCIDNVDDQHENIQVWSSHIGFGHDPSVMWAVADRLSQSPGKWMPFATPRYAMLAYPRAHSGAVDGPDAE
jgi:pimeloyl-ACP methyl ester carboxylesterase